MVRSLFMSRVLVSLRTALLLAFGLCILVSPAHAQPGVGTVSGQVTDGGHYVLPGARVELQPNGQSAVSDQQGRFAITNVPPGDYTLTISYVGLAPFTQKVTVSAGRETHVEAVLQVSGVNEQVTVSAERPRGEAQAINQPIRMATPSAARSTW